MTPPPPGRRWSGARDPSERALLYVPDYLTAPARAAIEAWLATLTPLWEQRYSTVRPPPPGKPQRPLLRFCRLGLHHLRLELPELGSG